MVQCDICRQLLETRDFIRDNALGYSMDQICIVCRLKGKTTEKKITSKYYSGIWCSYRLYPTLELCGDPECSVCFAESFASFQGKTPFGKHKTACWDTTINGEIIPSKISQKSGRRVWFECNNVMCSRSFKEVLSRITSKSSDWCPYCKTNVNAALFIFLQVHFPDVVVQYSPEWGWSRFTLKYSVFDFFIPSLNLIVDVDRRTHITDISKWTSVRETSAHEIFKLEKAREKGISVICILQKDIILDECLPLRSDDWRHWIEFKLKSGRYPETIPSICMITKNGEFPAPVQEIDKLESSDDFGYLSCDGDDETDTQNQTQDMFDE